MTDMRKTIACMALALLCVWTGASDWYGNKYSMFIHFGVYSSLGGVWKGKPVEYGYSEQIQACAGIYADQYADVAEAFNPTGFNADDLVALAKAAGMRSIVITSKHHDGFCMWGTGTTDYNSVDMSASGRDFIKEMSEACAKGGINLGLYFSLIDWHLPYGYPMTTHNSDPILPQHHEYNKAQVRELLTGYGSISELWFDMGSLTPEQSRELYELVHTLQPECMVSGRLGNDMYDFSVMGDNRYPDATLQIPWQTASSMFNETWGYRSWQKRCRVEEKASQKLRSLLGVVAHGGNFLLNIGPDDKGEVVPFERNVLLTMGRWLSANADVVYDTECSPFREDFGWGVVTRKGDMLNLILSGKCPEDGVISVPDPDADGRRLTFKVTPDDYADPCDIKVIRHRCRRDIEPARPAGLPSGTSVLSERNAVRDCSYSCSDYYTNFMSTIAMNWYTGDRLDKDADIIFTSGETGRKIRLEIDGKQTDLVLEGTSIPSQTIRFAPADSSFKSHILRKYSLTRTVSAPEEGDYLFEVGAGNAIMVLVNGRQVIRHLNGYRVPYTAEQVLLHLDKGDNEITVTCINRHEKNVRITLAPCTAPLYRMTIPVSAKGRSHHIRLTAEDRTSMHQDCRLQNLRIVL